MKHFMQPRNTILRNEESTAPSSPNPLKRKLATDTLPENVMVGVPDSGVQVIVRMRPINKEEEEGEMIVLKVGNDALKINGHTFTFDSVADIDSTQLVVLPFIENCLAGFNSSVFAYGQTGSGKTYTMWGPANALLEENLSSDKQGSTPRSFERLFSRINEEQIKHAEKQLNYQCCCSVLEIYNEQITICWIQAKEIFIREDVKSSVYVENLTEEYVCTMKDVTQLLIKESLGGNANLAIIYAVSPAQSCMSETFSTLRFAQRAKAIKSKAVVNEVMQDDVNYLREVIPQLRNLTDTNGGCSAGWARRSLNVVKRSLHHPMTLPHIDEEGDEEMEIDEDAVEKICDHVDMQLAGGEDNNTITEGRVETIKSHSKLEVSENGSFIEPQLNTSETVCIKEKGSEDAYVKMEEGISEQVVLCKNELMIADCAESITNTSGLSNGIPLEEKKALSSSVSGLPDKGSLSNSVRHGSSCPISDPLAAFSREISREDMPDESGNGSVNCVSPSCLSIL
ncbi:hypothetical protein Pint_16000 [Pistacia integerrima]|uniref:Uncharacterized protein n=1 Tax=Pistacia integerrima TaxID=434235 RepID=A0ACC0Z9N6_9ROSI|nr:hypothetical protein Pint_16000 [Pistacia integerrima]